MFCPAEGYLKTRSVAKSFSDARTIAMGKMLRLIVIAQHPETGNEAVYSLS